MKYEQLRKTRRELGVSQREMAEILGLRSKNAYSMKECGKRGFDVGEAIVIARYLDRSVEALFLTEESEQNGYFKGRCEICGARN